MTVEMRGVVLVCGLFYTTLLSNSFNIDEENPTLFTDIPGGQFGHKVVQFGTEENKSVIVSAPLKDNGTGGLYSCEYDEEKCRPIILQGLNPGIALGLSMATSSGSMGRLVACGPRLSRYCASNSFLNGFCYILNEDLTTFESFRPDLQECRDSGLDAVILFDDSHSISNADFKTMINFIKNIIRMFNDSKAQVSVAQYSSEARQVFNFKYFQVEKDPEKLMQFAQHSKGDTYTPTAIKFVLDKMFSEDFGMRNESKKLLIVITDGISNDKKLNYEDVIPLAESRHIIRYAIGIGKDFEKHKNDLQKIASSENNIFRVDSFDALTSIQKELREKIFAIEGSNEKSNFSSFQMELSQGGFSALITEKSMLLGAVGSFDWSGGALERKGKAETFINVSSHDRDMKSSYLGYSVEVVRLNEEEMYAIAAPRYKHKGLVIVFRKKNGTWQWSQGIEGEQLGSYFGAEICSLDVNTDGQTDFILIGAPLYYGKGIGGKVAVCSVELTGNLSCNSSLYGSPGNVFGRFGAAISQTADLNGDGLSDIAIGAPLEDDYRGSIYIFHGGMDQIDQLYSQKIQGKSIHSTLLLFGHSLHAAGDVTHDGMTDITVGAQDAAVILRSRPIINASVSLTFSPAVIPQRMFHCAGKESNDGEPATTADVCVELEPVYAGNLGSTVGNANVTISLELDPGQSLRSLVFHNDQRSVTWNMSVNGKLCHQQKIFVPNCIMNYSPILVSGNFSMVGLELPDMRHLTPVLTPSCKTNFTEKIELEKVCGEDEICVADLSVSSNFSGSQFLLAHPHFILNLTICLLNSGEDSYRSEVTIFYPAGLTFRKSSVLQSTWRASLDCNTEDLGANSHNGQTTCKVSNPILKEGAKIVLLASFNVARNSSLRDNVQINVTARSDNDNGSLHDNFASSLIPVKLPINVMVKGMDLTKYLNFTSSSKESKLLQHSYEVRNLGDVDIPVNFTFLVPLSIKPGFTWNVKNQTDPMCVILNNEPTAETKESSTSLNISKVQLPQQCHETLCQWIRCSILLLSKERPVTFVLSGNITKNIQMNAHKRTVTSYGELSYDNEKFFQYPVEKFNLAVVESELEILHEVNYAPIIVGSTFGGLLLLLLICYGLYKIGFFKRSVNEDLNEDTQVTETEETIPPKVELKGETSL
ncbi:integrin alpha-X-like [Polypterus senegalus]|uniref:integrin alpha-X-like n=1 Tax=Polypterus senegalus TaxID=55291 RepID=UPI0019627FCA|nr:integrin alpha-X-like [Polypterus senegalus]